MPGKGPAGGFSVVLVTCPPKAAERIARAVLDGRAAACVNIVPGVRSLYWWKEKQEAAEECLLVMKTKTALLAELEEVVRRAHPHEVPEIVALPVAWGHRPYLAWIEGSVAKGRLPRVREALAATRPASEKDEGAGPLRHQRR